MMEPPPSEATLGKGDIADSISIMEKSSKMVILPSAPDYSDLGMSGDDLYPSNKTEPCDRDSLDQSMGPDDRGFLLSLGLGRHYL